MADANEIIGRLRGGDLLFKTLRQGREPLWGLVRSGFPIERRAAEWLTSGLLVESYDGGRAIPQHDGLLMGGDVSQTWAWAEGGIQ